jgi:RNA polymerase sigma-70 factor (ECF subfamily)
MMEHTAPSDRLLQEGAFVAQFLESPSEDSFADLFKICTPQLISFFRTRGCETAVSEELAQEVMFIVYRKADQLRDRTLFRAWLFKVARTTLYRHYGKQSREVNTIELEKVADRLVAYTKAQAAMPALEFLHWMSFLDSREQEALILRFVEGWEYNEIAAEKAIPIGTVKWRVFNAKKKLAPLLQGDLARSSSSCVRRWNPVGAGGFVDC